MGALDRSTIATDASSTSKVTTKPGTVTTYHTSTGVASPAIGPTFPAASPKEMYYSSLGKPYPPCPGDPSNPSFPATPICPDISGNFPSTPWDPNAKWTGQTTFSTTASTYTLAPGTLNKDIYCPDVCIVTRYEANPPPPPVTGLIFIPNNSDFKDASCPIGYVQVTDFNMQPAITHIQVKDKLYGPFTTETELNEYKNNPQLYECSVFINPNNLHGPLLNPAAISDRQYAVNAANSVDPNLPCSDAVAGGVRGNDWVGQTLDKDTSINGLVGQWISQWTYSDFDANPTDCTPGNIFGCDFFSFEPHDTYCAGPTNPGWGSGVPHRDRFHHFYLYEHCRMSNGGGYFYTDTYQAASHLCTRIKPAWQPE